MLTTPVVEFAEIDPEKPGALAVTVTDTLSAGAALGVTVTEFPTFTSLAE